MTHEIGLNGSTVALAFLGDAVYEINIRSRLIKRGERDANRLHKLAIGYVAAKKQAVVIKTIMRSDFLTEEEQRLIKRSRNHKIGSKARGATPMEYKWATAFEALLGFLYEKGDFGRIDSIVDMAMGILEEAKK